MIQTTTLDAWIRLNEVEDGRRGSRRSKWQMIVYRALRDRGPMTRNELDRYLKADQANPSPSRRLIELERLDLIEVSQIRKCQISGQNCFEYRVTGRPPRLLEAYVVPTHEELALFLSAFTVLEKMAGFAPQCRSEGISKVLDWLERKSEGRKARPKGGMVQ